MRDRKNKANSWWSSEWSNSILLSLLLPLLVVVVVVAVSLGPKVSTSMFSSCYIEQYLRSIKIKGVRSNNSANSSRFHDIQEMKGQPNVSTRPKLQKTYSDIEMLETSLAHARAAIRAAANRKNLSVDPDYVPTGPMYWNPSTFQRSYLEMEKRFKVYIYEDGDPPIFHYGPGKHTYAVEGHFIFNMEVSRFRTYDPKKAHLFFIPMSITMITQNCFTPGDWTSMKNTAKDYVIALSQKYPFWNRTHGADHFLVACHDWGPELSFTVPDLYQKSIRALCNANTSEKFDPLRDVSIPEILLPAGTMDGMIGGPPPSRRPILVFYAGGIHGPIRPVLLEHWQNKDPDIQIYEYLPKNISYYGMMRKSKYCLCPSGYEVASPRTVEGLYMGCVPVLIKEGYVIPFSDVLNWETFAVVLSTSEIPNLKKILESIPQKKYLQMQKRGIQMRRHFEVHSPPKRYDVFHMILHSIWLRRLNIRLDHHVQED